MRTHVYVDGFNLYYGAVRGTKFRWLNIVELTRQILPAGHTIDKVKYFTARVSGAQDPGAPARQQVYFNALRTLPEVEIHFGRFLAKTVWRPLTNLPVAGDQIHSAPPVMLPAGNHRVAGRLARRPVTTDRTPGQLELLISTRLASAFWPPIQPCQASGPPGAAFPRDVRHAPVRAERLPRSRWARGQSAL